MATVTDIVKQIDRLEDIIRSAERTQQFIEDFFRQNRQLATFYKDTLCHELARRGWFIAGSLYPNQINLLSGAFKQGGESEIEEFLKAHTEKNFPTIRRSALSRWPKREGILTDAFDAHVAKKFTLSVPVLLSQADGISADLIGPLLFSDHRGSIANKAKSLIKDKCSARPLAASFLDLLVEGLLTREPGLRIDTRKRDELVMSGQIVSPLNRHGVMHGLDCDYATNGNSLRGIALIGFLDWVAEVIQEDDGESPNRSIIGEEE